MFNWGGFTLFLYIVMRMSGFVLMGPIYGRNGIPAMFQAGFIALLSLTVYSAYGGSAPVPDSVLVLGVRLLAELLLGFAVGMVMRFFFNVAEQAGEIIDTQMGLTMARTYDAGSGASVTVMANFFNTLMLLLFFAANGHVTLVRIFLTSGEIVPYGAVRLGEEVGARCVELFAECVLLALKMSLPVLGAELLAQMGMGILMKVIPQINVFAINIELKVIIGFGMILFLFSPIGNYLLELESQMLREVRNVMTLLR